MCLPARPPRARPDTCLRNRARGGDKTPAALSKARRPRPGGSVPQEGRQVGTAPNTAAQSRRGARPAGSPGQRASGRQAVPCFAEGRADLLTTSAHCSGFLANFTVKPTIPKRSNRERPGARNQVPSPERASVASVTVGVGVRGRRPEAPLSGSGFICKLLILGSMEPAEVPSVLRLFALVALGSHWCDWEMTDDDPGRALTHTRGTPHQGPWPPAPGSQGPVAATAWGGEAEPPPGSRGSCTCLGD